MRHLSAFFEEGTEAWVMRVTNLEKLAAEWQPHLSFAVCVSLAVERKEIESLRAAGLKNLVWVESDKLEYGDIIVPRVRELEAVVLYRESDRHHGLLLTNRCNSNCLMCSQPPTANADDWLVDEALEVIRHFALPPKVLGLTGGEPLLLHGRLRDVLDRVSMLHHTTLIEVLTNGRLLASNEMASDLLHGLGAKVYWLVPLYGHADIVHDFVVQAAGAFEETIAGLLNLQMYRQPVQLRVVLIQPVLEVLPEICTFIGKNLPFIQEVALMACEPTGFALANRDFCQVDLAEWSNTLEDSTRILQRHAIPYLFMNIPLCALPQSLWSYAHKSISDWKNEYSGACSVCQLRNSCSGLFIKHKMGWEPTVLKPIKEVSL